jgi:serine/threonine protein phosphatase 1
MMRTSVAVAAPRPTPAPAPRAAVDEQRFALLGRAGRVWAVASVHGEAARLRRLHDLLAHRVQTGDRLVYLGNLLGRGAAVRETVDEALAFRRSVIAQPRAFAADVAFLRGGQEEMWQKLLQLQFAASPGEVLSWMLDHGAAATIEAYGGDAARGLVAVREGAMGLTRWTASLRAGLDAVPGHRQYLSALRRAAYSDEGLLFVHAGIDPAQPLDFQRDAFWWGGGSRFLALEAPFSGFKRVIRGFDQSRSGLVEGAYATSLDGGSGFGGELLAACFDCDGQVVDRLAA